MLFIVSSNHPTSAVHRIVPLNAPIDVPVPGACLSFIFSCAGAFHYIMPFLLASQLPGVLLAAGVNTQR